MQIVYILIRLPAVALFVALAFPVGIVCKVISAQRGAKLLLLFLRNIGGTFAKLGQMLSTRMDFLPAQYLQELAQLTDRMHTVRLSSVYRQIESDTRQLMSAMFTEFDGVPIACASIAQVHCARLIDGRRVAVKVRRPGIRFKLRADLFWLEWIAQGIGFLGIPWAREIARIFADLKLTVDREADFMLEALSLDRAHKLLSASALDHAAPGVLFEYSGSGTLTMELFEGIWFNDLCSAILRGDAALLNRWRADFNIDTRRLAKLLFQSLAEQMCVHKFVHADPHGGNIVLLRSGTIGFVDFGIVGTLDERLSQQQMALLRALGAKKVHGAFSAMISMVEPLSSSSYRALEPKIKQIIADWLLAASASESPLAKKSNGRMLMRCAAAFRSVGAPLPWAFITVIRATVLSDMLVYILDPGFDASDELSAFFENRYEARNYDLTIATEAAKTLAHGLGNTIETLEGLMQWFNLGLLSSLRSLEQDMTISERVLRRVLTLAQVCALSMSVILGLHLTAQVDMVAAWVPLGIRRFIDSAGATTLIGFVAITIIATYLKNCFQKY